MPPAEFCTPLNNIRCRLPQSPVLIQCLLVTLSCHHNWVCAAEPYDLCCGDATLAFLCRYVSVTMLHVAITSISMNLQCSNISNTRIATLLLWQNHPLLLAISLRNIRAVVFADSFQSDPSDTHQSTISQTLSSTILVLVPQGNVHCAMCLYILYRVIFLTVTPMIEKRLTK